MRDRLKPDGIVATMKAVDADGLLFNRYAASFREAGCTSSDGGSRREGCRGSC
jgi:hypothetical protein